MIIFYYQIRSLITDTLLIFVLILLICFPQHFLKLLLASADYKDFSRIMVREARFYYDTGMSSFGRLPAEDEARLREEADKEADEAPSRK